MLVEGEDYILNEKGLMVFTKQYHLKRGYCCKNLCLNCPWDFAASLRRSDPAKKQNAGRENDKDSV